MCLASLCSRSSFLELEYTAKQAQDGVDSIQLAVLRPPPRTQTKIQHQSSQLIYLDSGIALAGTTTEGLTSSTALRVHALKLGLFNPQGFRPASHRRLT